MEIKTKFNIGDIVITYNELDGFIKCEVININIEILKSNAYETYALAPLYDLDLRFKGTQDNTFASKQELKNYIDIML